VYIVALCSSLNTTTFYFLSLLFTTSDTLDRVVAGVLSQKYPDSK
jgi:hypothetical protein